MDARLRAVLFDLDGTLLDTAPDMVAALNELRAERGAAPLPFDSVRPAVSHGSARLVRLGFPEADAATVADLQRRYLEIYGASLAVRTRLFPGMEDVLAAIESHGLRCGIVTNKPASLTGALLGALGLEERFACVVGGDTVSERKPHAMPMLHAARLAGVGAEECVYIGDAERDIQAAHAAGMHGLVATYGYLAPGEDWRAWGGDGALGEPRDLIGWLADSGRL